MSERELKTFAVLEVARMTGIDQQTLILFIEREWICPRARDLLDEEDVARIHLIREFRDRFGANDESIPVILHLLDQLYFLRDQVRKLGG